MIQDLKDIAQDINKKYNETIEDVVELLDLYGEEEKIMSNPRRISSYNFFGQRLDFCFIVDTDTGGDLSFGYLLNFPSIDMENLRFLQDEIGNNSPFNDLAEWYILCMEDKIWKNKEKIEEFLTQIIFGILKTPILKTRFKNIETDPIALTALI